MTRPNGPDIDFDEEAVTIRQKGHAGQRDAFLRKVASLLRKHHGKQLIVEIGHELKVQVTDTHPLEAISSSLHSILDALTPTPDKKIRPRHRAATGPRNTRQHPRRRTRMHGHTRR